jgi:hypothetical protein
MQREVWIEHNPEENTPIFWDYQDDNGILYGKKGKVHTVSIPIKVPKVRMDYDLRAVNDKGKLIVRQDESHSWTRNYYNWVSGAMGKSFSDATFQDGSLSSKTTAGTVLGDAYGMMGHHYSSSVESGNVGYYAGVATSSSGIQLGTSPVADHPESLDDFVLPHPISNGVGAGNLLYQTSPTPAPDIWDSGSRTKSYKLSRFFDNFSGNSITATEMSQVANLVHEDLTTVKSFMVARDLITDLIIADRSCAVASYIYSLIFPSSGSPLRNFYNYLFSSFASVNGSDATNFQDGNINIKDTGGTVRSGANALTFGSVYDKTSTFGFYRAAGSNASGGQAGTSSTAIGFDDYALNSLIAHGTDGGQMSYGVTEAPSRSWSDPVMTIQQARTITNSSGNTITIKNVGIVGGVWLNTLLYNTLMVADVITDVAVANGESIRVVHRFSVTYP